VSIEGSTAIVTGASQGIGKASALGLARLGLDVVLVSRDPQRAETAVAELRAASGNPRVESLLADLSSQSSVRELAAQLLARPGRLAVLLNNAGVASPERMVTADGLEFQFAVNHLAPFLLTNLLQERLVNDGPGRVVTVASRVHERGTIDFDDLQGERDYTGARAYNQSKLANVLFTYELARRLDGTGVTANCLHPGVVSTNLNNYLGSGRAPSTSQPSLGMRMKRAMGRKLAALKGRSSEVCTADEACGTSVHLATSPDVEQISGAYFVNRRQAESSAASHDEGLAARLWQVSERLTGIG